MTRAQNTQRRSVDTAAYLKPKFFGRLLLFVALFAVSAKAQQPVAPLQPYPIDTSFPGVLYVEGVWGLHGHLESDNRIDSSVIECRRAEGTCHESFARADFTGGTFVNTPESWTYRIERWDQSEVLAVTIALDCRVRHVLKFDLKQKRVFWSESPSEPMGKLSDGFDCGKVKTEQRELYRKTSFHLPSPTIRPASGNP